MTNIVKSLLLLAGVAVMAAGCSKETSNNENQSGMIEVSVEAGLENTNTKAISDRDGNAKKVNHWIMEVRDAAGNLYTRDERDSVAAGTLVQVFTVTLVKGNSYSFQFWADTKGSYVTTDLTAVSVVDTVANRDSLDAFSTNKAYEPSMGKSVSATLTRPFAQLNIQSNDLESLWSTTDSTEYMLFEPKDLKVKFSLPKTFNVKTQTAGTASSVTLAAESAYTAYQADSTTLETQNNFCKHVNPATFFMDYIFAGTEKTLNEITFSFTTNSKTVNHNFSNIPLQRNYRTNIVGALLTDQSEWTVTIDPIWKTPAYEVDADN